MRLEILPEHYEPTKEVLLTNGAKVWEQTFGSRRNLYGDGHLFGSIGTGDYLPLSEITKNQFGAFLGQFTKSLYNQIRKNDSLLDLKIEFNDVSRNKNLESWNKLKSREVFYNVDLSSAYWQIAFKLGYISRRMFDSYIDKDAYKEAKRYCISFLARENEMNYYDQREIDNIKCNNDCLYQIYTNIRNELYTCISNVKPGNDWIEYNIDGISVMAKDLDSVCKKFDEMNLKYKINECAKLDKKEYTLKERIRKF